MPIEIVAEKKPAAKGFFAFRPARPRLRRIFNRRSTGWADRDFDEALDPIQGALDQGRIACRLVHLSADACAAALAAPSDPGGSEGVEHAHLQAAAALWMRDLGMSGVKQEARCCVGRADVFCAEAGWIVECGATPLAKLTTAITTPGIRRFTLIPYQRLRPRNGASRRLIAADFAWDQSIADEVEAAARGSAWARMRELEGMRPSRPWLRLAGLPSPIRSEGA